MCSSDLLNLAGQGQTGVGAVGTAGLSVGGQPNPNSNRTEVWNGTNWTEVNNLNTQRDAMGASQQAPSTAALVFGGSQVGTPKNETESWNGTNWTEVNNLNTSRQNLRGSGETNTASLAFGGKPTTAVTELWNGTNWTEVNDLNTARQQFARAGTATETLAFGGKGTPGKIANTELWNGTKWTEKTDLLTE